MVECVTTKTGTIINVSANLDTLDTTVLVVSEGCLFIYNPIIIINIWIQIS